MKQHNALDMNKLELLYSISLHFWENGKAFLNTELESLHRTEQQGKGVANTSFHKTAYASQ